MGTINYKTSDYITIGYNCNDIDYDEPLYHDFIDDDYMNVEGILNQYYFYYFNIRLKPGYYEGFYIDIEYNFPLFFDDYKERQEAQKEITTIKEALIKCFDYGCCAVHPGWCMAYLNNNDSLKALQEAIKEMREEVKATPTLRQYEKGV